MTCLSIHDLAVFTGGHLRLGILPPLGGLLEPVRRIHTDLDQLQAGDIYWQLEQSADIHAAFARGAMGIIYEGSRIEPWAGRFSLQVRSAEHALRLAAARTRRLYTGCLLAVHDLGAGDPAGRNSRDFLGRLHQLTPLEGQFQPHDAEGLALDIIHLDGRRPFSVFNLYRQLADERHGCLQRLEADVIVTSRGAAEGLSASKARLIYCDDYDGMREVAEAAFEAGQSTRHKEPCVALPSMSGLRESDMPTLLGRSNQLADRWLLGRSPWRVLPGRA